MSNYSQSDDRRKWAIKKEISVGDIVAFCVAAVSVIYAYSTLDRRIAVIEDRYITQQKYSDRADNEASAYRAKVDAQLAEINRKLDRMIGADRRDNR